MKKTTQILLLLLLGAGGLLAEDPPPEAEGKPLWEFGLFNGVAVLPEYPGSDEYDTYVLPLPYFIYRGEYLEAHREGASGVFYRSDTVEAKLAFSGHPPVGDDNDARRGMEELDPLLLLGPEVNLYARNTVREKCYLHLVALQALSIDSGELLNPGTQGLFGKLQLIYKNEDFLGVQDLRYGMRAGAYLASDRYADYFYSVDERDAVEGRAAFDADPGYAGSVFSHSLSCRINRRFRAAAFVRWYNFDGASFQDSPLVREDNNLFGGVALVWNIAESKQRVRR